MPNEEETVSREEAREQLKSMITRTAMIHYAFVKTMMDELGAEKGKALAKKAVMAYGEMVGKRAKDIAGAKGLPNTAENFPNDLPSLGWWDRERVLVDGEKRARVHTCYLAKAWQELGVPEIGRLYCFVDQAKYEAYNPDLECVHTKNVLDGDPYCELAVRTRKKR
ncbi:MAG TPA: L-2-amino-thiazoline-4-carboxylic acid hydrolase [Thermodesulfobacteriota bacterium]|nr:L-2-amino-thiazoline-4-carboxylic acid hydrolase [Thermodesulfobacteriota bacterium]